MLFDEFPIHFLRFFVQVCVIVNVCFGYGSSSNNVFLTVITRSDFNNINLFKNSVFKLSVCKSNNLVICFQMWGAKHYFNSIVSINDRAFFAGPWCYT